MFKGNIGLVLPIKSAVYAGAEYKLSMEKEFDYKRDIAIADSDDVPSIFGRVKGLDEFDAKFLKREKHFFLIIKRESMA